MNYMTNAELVRQYAEFIKAFGDSLLNVADNLAKNPINLYPLEDVTPKEDPEHSTEKEPEKNGPEQPKEIHKEDVRAALVRVVNAKGNDAARNILNRYGAKNLTALSPEYYEKVIKDAEEIENAPC